MESVSELQGQTELPEQGRALEPLLCAGNVAAGAVMLTTGDPTAGLLAIGATTAMGGIMGAHMTASIGGADM